MEPPHGARGSSTTADLARAGWIRPQPRLWRRIRPLARLRWWIRRPPPQIQHMGSAGKGTVSENALTETFVQRRLPLPAFENTFQQSQKNMVVVVGSSKIVPLSFSRKTRNCATACTWLLNLSSSWLLTLGKLQDYRVSCLASNLRPIRDSSLRITRQIHGTIRNYAHPRT